MPQFYFHLWRGGQLSPDEVGVALPNLRAAKRRAERMAASVPEQNEDAPLILVGWDIEVADAAGRTCLVVPVGSRCTATKQSQAA